MRGMDYPFPIAEWQPTQPLEPGEIDSRPDLPCLSQALAMQTTELYRHPYDPACWLRRAKTLADLRYPELAVGDAHKAILLIRSSLDKLSRGSRWLLGQRMGFWMLDELGYGPVSVDHAELEQRLLDLQDEACQVKEGNLYHWPTFDEGRYLPRPYPWMAERHRRRNDELVAELNAEFGEQARRLQRGETDCVIQRHAFGRVDAEAVREGDSSEVLGVFAARDIPSETIILIDRTEIFGCIGPGLHGGRADLHGGQGCADPTHPNVPSDLLDRDLRWVRERTGRQAAEIILRCRLLMRCIEAGAEHALDDTLLARLTPTYRRVRAKNFSFQDDISIPNEWLQLCGVDIFANEQYDTWVLFTICARETNNSWSEPIHSCLSPLFSLFNHSCEPNVAWNSNEDQTTLTLKTTRDVRKGEQLFVHYDEYMRDQPLQARRRRMHKWLDAECQCSRCVREEAEDEIHRHHSEADSWMTA